MRSDRRFIYLLTAAHGRLRQHVQAQGGATAARSGLLLAVRDDADGTPLAEVGRALDFGASTLSGLVDRMTRAGLVERVPDPGDGRAFLVRLTEPGREARSRARRRAGAINAALSNGFTDDELATVARWLEAVRTRFAKEKTP